MLHVPAVKGVRLFHVFYSDLGVHVDGFISNVAHSLVVGATKVSHAIPSTASCLSALLSDFEHISSDYFVVTVLGFFFPGGSSDGPESGRDQSCLPVCRSSSATR